MAKILINTFATELEAKNFFAKIVEGKTIHGAFVAKAGKVFVEGTADPVVAGNKFVVLSTSADVFSDEER